MNQLPVDFIPKSTFIQNKMDLNPLPLFPFIVKPDLGERGVNVELIRNENDWNDYPIGNNLIIQKYIDLPYEFGVFYARKPFEESGKILSVTGKKYMEFISDGKSSLKEYIEKNERAYFRKNYLENKYKLEMDAVFPRNTKILLEPIGNHNRGTEFFDASYLISKDLEIEIDKASKSINGFYYGRFDVKTKSEEELKNGNFIILEVNGANSEPTHIYDKEYSLYKAYKEVKRHLDIQFQISITHPKNHSDFEFIMAILKKIF